jgi:hypothetical protein
LTARKAAKAVASAGSAPGRRKNARTSADSCGIFCEEEGNMRGEGLCTVFLRQQWQAHAQALTLADGDGAAAQAAARRRQHRP